MANETLEMKQLGLRVKFLRTAEDTGGELLEMEVEGRPRGFLSQRHVHPGQVGSLRDEGLSHTGKFVVVIHVVTSRHAHLAAHPRRRP